VFFYGFAGNRLLLMQQRVGDAIGEGAVGFVVNLDQFDRGTGGFKRGFQAVQ
jgi:hypothetical protein